MGLLWHEIGQKETFFRFDFQIFPVLSRQVLPARRGLPQGGGIGHEYHLRW